MPEGLFHEPDPIAALVARISSLEQQVQVLGAAARVGLSSIRTARQFDVVFAAAFAPTWEYAPAGATFVTDSNSTPVAGYSQLTMTVGGKIVVMFGGRLEGLANVATSRSAGGTLGVQIDGVDGALTAGLNFQTNAGNHDVPQATIAEWTVAPGVHTLKLGVRWDNTVPAAANLPRLSNGYLTVMPLTT